jgi:hypothetical protein
MKWSSSSPPANTSSILANYRDSISALVQTTRGRAGSSPSFGFVEFRVHETPIKLRTQPLESEGVEYMCLARCQSLSYVLRGKGGIPFRERSNSALEPTPLLRVIFRCHSASRHMPRNCGPAKLLVAIATHRPVPAAVRTPNSHRSLIQSHSRFNKRPVLVVHQPQHSVVISGLSVARDHSAHISMEGCNWLFQWSCLCKQTRLALSTRFA